MSVIAAAVVTTAVTGAYSASQAGKASKNAANAQKESAAAMAASSDYAADISKKIADEDRAETKRQFDENLAISRPIVQKQTAILDQTLAQGEDYDTYNKTTFRPIEKSLADEAMSGGNRYDSNVDVRANSESEARRATADVTKARENAVSQNQRAMLSIGVNPNSGKFAAMSVEDSLDTAAAKAGAATASREKAVSLDFAKRMDVTGLGRNLPGASQGAYSVANNAGDSVVKNTLAPSATYQSGIRDSNSTLMAGQGLKVQGLGSLNSANMNLAYGSSKNFYDVMGGAAGMAGTLGAAYLGKK
jgi:hypothetical protein